MDGYGIFIETLKGNLVAVAWYVDEDEALMTVDGLSAAFRVSDYLDICNSDFLSVRPLNLSDHQKDAETC